MPYFFMIVYFVNKSSIFWQFFDFCHQVFTTLQIKSFLLSRILLQFGILAEFVILAIYIYLLFILYIQHTAFFKLFFVKLRQKFASKFLLQLAILVEFNLLFLLCKLLFLLNYTFPLAVFLSLKLGEKTCKQIFVTECNPGHKCGHREGEQNGTGNIATKLTIIQKLNPNNLDNIIRF